jgi:serine/threonine protein kinase/tetratricopeptide (TPR) repeat protein
MTDESVFAAAVAIHSPNKRAAFLDRACAGNPALRREVESLLSAHAADNPLDRPPADLGRTGAYEPDLTADPPPAAVGERIGPYRLMEQIGEGGFGLVFVAEQGEPVRRKVALKVLKPGMDTKDVVARFEAERQALALMDHPNIARVFDAGSTAQGRPYFVMELVRGVPITDYCDEHKLPTRDRLALFVQVCQAVQHAHQKGIIHRDLKPSNILVAPHDGVPVVKVIDFGVAKALGQSLTEKTIYTRFAQMIGTPLYMSPEQAEVNQLDVDTRADVYALGVLLYELLTGTTPFDKDRFKRAAFDEIRRIIKEEEPPRPSTRLTSLGATLTAVSANRQVDPGKLAGLVRGELDWIAMKALEKDRTRRYETANGLASDVLRYLSGEPVQAVPPSAGYRLRKFARKNRGPVLAAALVLVALSVGVVGTTAGLIRARQLAHEASDEAARTKAALRLAGERYVLAGEAADSFLSKITEDEQLKEGDNFDLRRRLLTDAIPLLKRLTEDDPTDDRQRLALALAHKRVGDIANALQDHAAGRKSLEAAEAILEALIRDRPDEPEYRIVLGRVQNNLGSCQSGPASEAAYAKSRQAFTELAERYPDKPEYQLFWALSLSNRGLVIRDAGRTDESRKLFEQAIRIVTPLVEANTKDPRYMESVARAYQCLAPTYPQGTAGIRDREKTLRTAIQWYDRLLALHPRRGLARSQKADSCKELADLLMRFRSDEAIGLLRQTLAEYERLAADFPSLGVYRRSLVESQANLAFQLGVVQQREEADRLFAAAMARAGEEVARHPTRDNRWTEATTHVNRARYLARGGDFAGQQAELLTAVDRYERIVKDEPNDRVIRRVLAETLAEAAGSFAGKDEADPAKVLELNDRAVRVLEPLRGTGTPDPNIASIAVRAITPRIAAFSASDRYAEVLAECDRYATWLPAGAKISEVAAFHRARALIRTGRADAGLAGYESTVGETTTPTGLAWRLSELQRAALYALAHAATGKVAYAEKAAAVLRDDAERMKKPGAVQSFNISTPRIAIVRDFTDPAFDSVRDREDFVRAKAEWVDARAKSLKTPPSMARALAFPATIVRNGDHARGTGMVESVLKRRTPDGEAYYVAAGVFALAAGAASDDPAQKDRYAERAIELLRLAVENGWNDPDNAAKNSDLDAIRNRAAFREIMQSVPERKKGGPETAPSPRPARK